MKPEAAAFAAITLALAVAACAGLPMGKPKVAPTSAISDVAPSTPMPSGQVFGFLTPETTPDATAIIPPAPREGEPRNDADWAVFRYSRALEGSDRWKLAQSDNSYEPTDILSDFSCSMDAQLTPQSAPALSLLLQRAAQDAATAAARAKQVYQRTRPFLHNAGNICIPKSDSLIKSFDYPSGHASLSWVDGLILAQLAPERAQAVLVRARAFGDSRIVCGVHNWSAVDAGRLNASSVFAALQASPEFQRAMKAADVEVKRIRASGAKPEAASCQREVELTKPLFVDLTK